MTAPGTYTGADGREYRWAKNVIGRYYICRLEGPATLVGVDPADWPAAKAALDALVEQEEEWVEIGDWRVDREGTKAQFRFRVDGTTTYQWGERMGDGKAYSILGPYRKGREQAQQEAAKEYNQMCALGAETRTKYLALRDAARELVRTINAMPSVTFDCSVLPIMQGGYHLAEDVRVDVNARQLMRWMDTLDKAAKKLEGKL